MGRKWVLGLAVVALVLLALGLWRALRPTPTPPGILETNGRIEGDQAAIGVKVGGKIVRLAVREGDQLEAGALIAALASEQVQAQLEQAEHARHTAREQIAAAEAGVVSTQRQIDAARTAVTLAEREAPAQIGEAQAAREAAQARLRQAEADLEKAAKDYQNLRRRGKPQK